MKGADRMVLKIIVFCGLIAAVWNQDPHNHPHHASHPHSTHPPIVKKAPHLPRIECPNSWEVGTFKCYKVVYLPADWINALMYCIVMRAHLLEIDSKEEEVEVKKLLYKTHGSSIPNMRLWIDGSDMSNEGQWQWMNYGQNITYTNWYGNKQPPTGRNLHCAILLGDTFRWGASDCAVKRPFICEANPLRILPFGVV